MLRAFVFTAFICPIISLILDRAQKATKKAKFTNTGFENIVGHLVVFAVFVLLIELCAWALKRHKVVIDGDILHITPAVGRTRKIAFHEISRYTEKEHTGLKLFVGKKKICTVSCDCVGYKEFREMLKKRVTCV